MANERKNTGRHGIVVYTFQVGDQFHYGHLNALRQANKLGDYLIVGVLTNEAVRAYKRSPITTFKERLAIIRHCDYVDLAVRQDSVDPTENIKTYKPDILVHGDDWDENFPGAEYMRSIGGKVVLTKYYPRLSATSIMNKIVRRAFDDMMVVMKNYSVPHGE